jgi:ABC-type sugar transport system ATPase subunit
VPKLIKVSSGVASSLSGEVSGGETFFSGARAEQTRRFAHISQQIPDTPQRTVCANVRLDKANMTQDNIYFRIGHPGMKSAKKFP